MISNKWNFKIENKNGIHIFVRHKYCDAIKNDEQFQYGLTIKIRVIG